MSFAIRIIITLCLSSIWCFQDVKDKRSGENDQWILSSKTGENECKGDENEWIKPTVIGYLVGLLIGAIFGIVLCVASIYHCILKNLKFFS
ncbi:hypothetical protein ACH3XW_12970 [Acanthocheilonema viteae]